MAYEENMLEEYFSARLKHSRIASVMPKGLRVTPKELTAEGDRVAVEAESYGEHANGTIYNNQYHFLVEVRDGKVQAVREYLDTIHAQDVLVG